jgi:DNA-binding transcriptional MocR family regulator
MERFLAAKEQIGICGSIIDEQIAEVALAEAPQFLAKIDKQLRASRAIVEDWIAREKRMEWVKPQGGCVCFPRIRADAGIDVEKFYKALTEHGTLVGAGHWFEQDRRFMRIGYGWPLEVELRGGLAAISASLDAAKR